MFRSPLILHAIFQAGTFGAPGVIAQSSAAAAPAPGTGTALAWTAMWPPTLSAWAEGQSRQAQRPATHKHAHVSDVYEVNSL